MPSENKRIAKNTIYLYLRMMLTMIISLYTSRVILHVLGVNDYGIYNVVGGVVGFLSFVTAALSAGSSRFLTFEMGTGDKEKLRKTFCSTLSVHIMFSLFIVLLAETIGLWFVNNKLQIPASRMFAANCVYQLSIITAVFSITQVPYTSVIIAHEKMDIYAYMSIYDVTMKLLICYLLYIGNIDKLILYAILIFLIQLSDVLFYRIYSIRHFEESKFKFFYDKKILGPILKFSGWSLFANLSIALNNQGTSIITNMFFGPAVVSASVLSATVSGAANSFITNFRTAANPQIVKMYAAKDYEGSKKLLLNSTKFSFYLMFILALPIILLADPLLHLWLMEVPPYTVVFLRIVMVQSLFCVFDSSFYTALYTKGRLRENALISPMVGFLCFPIVYILFKRGFSPVAMSWVSLCSYVLLGLVVKPMLIIKIVNYTWKDVLSVFTPCLMIVILSTPIPLFATCFLGTDSYINDFIILLTSLSFVSIIVYMFGINKETRHKINQLVLCKLHKQ
jgi:O-antigen/teichoic acid export membrane protein